MFIVFVGPPGVGKGTQCRLLREHFELTHLSTGEILRQAISDGTDLGAEAKKFINDGQLVPDQIMIDLIDERLFRDSQPRDCLLDGYPRTIEQAEALDELLENHGASITVVIELVADREEIRNRIIQRARNEGRADDDPITVQRRLLIYEKQTAPIVEYYRKQGKLQKIDGIGDPQEVFQRIIDFLNQDSKQTS